MSGWKKCGYGSDLEPLSRFKKLYSNIGHQHMHVFSNDFFVGWGTLTLINAGLAQGKNRSGLNWFLLSLLFGPLATLALVVMAKRP
jgi:hypothetical protein